MQQRRKLIFGHAAAALLVAASGCAAAGQGSAVPTFAVDPLWPMPLEYPYILGPVSGVAVAPDGNILIVTRQDGFSQVNEINSVTLTGTCCTPSQAVLEYAPDGTLVRQWGGPDNGYPWPQRPHGIAVDPEGNVWIGGGVAAGGGGGGGAAAAAAARAGGQQAAQQPPIDSHILKFSRDGRHLMTIGQAGVGQAANAHSNNAFGGAARFAFDAANSEVYVADGYANRRVAVLDMRTGQIKRSWGAYGNRPDNSPIADYAPGAAPAQQFRNVTCVRLANDNLVYVCDRASNRIQVFRTDGTFVAEKVLAPNTLSLGSVWDIAFSSDPSQQFLFVADGMNERVYVVDRQSLEVRTSFGTGGRVPGTFHELGSLAVDARGNLYTAENGQGRRVQKFQTTGMGRVTAEHQGPVWPRR
jgi:DNA-binding beta-propeller fold protein YncE